MGSVQSLGCAWLKAKHTPRGRHLCPQPYHGVNSPANGQTSNHSLKTYHKILHRLRFEKRPSDSWNTTLPYSLFIHDKRVLNHPDWFSPSHHTFNFPIVQATQKVLQNPQPTAAKEPCLHGWLRTTAFPPGPAHAC